MALDPEMIAAPMARRAVEGWLLEWGLDDLCGDVLLVLSELVTNAILHAGTQVQVLIKVGRAAVEVLVQDGERRLPVQQGVGSRGLSDTSEAGRGLLIVDQLSDEWGVTQLAHGKQVWALLTPPASWSHLQACPDTQAGSLDL